MNTISFLAFATLFAILLSGLYTIALVHHNSRFSRWSIVALLAIPVALFLFFITAFPVNVPIVDDFDAIAKYLSVPFSQRLTHLFDFHNEHRIFVTRILLEIITGVTGTLNFRLVCFIGNLQILLLSFLFGRRFVSRFGNRGWFYFIPVCWLMLSFLNYINACCAMTAIGNYAVLLWGFVSVLVASNARLHFWYLSIPCAWLCTFSSGGGMMIWFALAAMATAKLLVTESTWSVCLGKVQKNMRQVNPPTYVAAAVFCAVAILSIAFYFHSFPIDENPYASHSVLTSFLFFLAFLGHIVGFYPLSLLIGSLLLISLIVLIIRFPKISQEARPVFFFLLFLLMQMASAAIFRGAVPGHALVARYTVVSLCSFTCFVFLVLDQLPEDWKPLRLLCPLLAFACLGISLTFFAWRGPTFWEEQQIKRRNLLTWPTHIEGLAYPEGRKHEASKILEQLERTKLYNHESARKANEEIPELPSAVSY